MSGSPEVQMLGDAQSAKAITGTESQKNKIPYGYCQCGCGEKTWIHVQSVTKRGYVKGRPARFKTGQNSRVGSGPNANRWKGGTKFDRKRKLILMPDHHRAHKGRKYVYNHILVVEKATGLKIKSPIIIHHVNGDKSDDRNSNLVVCQDQAYHLFIEERTRSYYACGHAGWLKCTFCKQYDDPKNMYVKGKAHYHRKCANEYNRNLRVIKTYNKKEEGENEDY